MYALSLGHVCKLQANVASTVLCLAVLRTYATNANLPGCLVPFANAAVPYETEKLLSTRSHDQQPPPFKSCYHAVYEGEIGQHDEGSTHLHRSPPGHWQCPESGRPAPETPEAESITSIKTGRTHTSGVTETSKDHFSMQGSPRDAPLPAQRADKRPDSHRGDRTIIQR